VSVYYLEPSALVKYYVAEPGSAWVRAVVDTEGNVLATAEITIAEVSAALGVSARAGRISHRQRDEFWYKFKLDFLAQCQFLPTHRALVNHAADLCQKHPLRGFDAIHLASGLQLQDILDQQVQRQAVVYITGDGTLAQAAQVEGLAVDNPFWHTNLDPS
jgi:predicted nucleic acid-binding protein